MVDIHTHVLFGIDDGAKSVEESLAIMSSEFGGGTRAMIATPHLIEGSDYDRMPMIVERAAELRSALGHSGLHLELAVGAEVYPSWRAIQGLNEGVPMTLAGKRRHMLVDLPMTRLPDLFDDFIHEVLARGIQPIIAHPERCGSFQRNPRRVLGYIEKGAALQVNAGSLTGKYGERAKETVAVILENRWASFMASDVHRVHELPLLDQARELALGMVDEEYVQLLTQSSGRAVLEGRPLPERPAVPEGEPSRRRQRLGKLWPTGRRAVQPQRVTD